jgi:hypothetical protein
MRVTTALAANAPDGIEHARQPDCVEDASGGALPHRFALRARLKERRMDVHNFMLWAAIGVVFCRN